VCNVAVITFLFKEITLNKKMYLDYESLILPETSIFNWSRYIPVTNQSAGFQWELKSL
jgi:hypothetical protein